MSFILNMPSSLKFMLIGIIIAICCLVGYIIHLSKLEKQQKLATANATPLGNKPKETKSTKNNAQTTQERGSTPAKVITPTAKKDEAKVVTANANPKIGEPIKMSPSGNEQLNKPKIETKVDDTKKAIENINTTKTIKEVPNVMEDDALAMVHNHNNPKATEAKPVTSENTNPTETEEKPQIKVVEYVPKFASPRIGKHKVDVNYDFDFTVPDYLLKESPIDASTLKINVPEFKVPEIKEKETKPINTVKAPSAPSEAPGKSLDVNKDKVPETEEKAAKTQPKPDKAIVNKNKDLKTKSPIKTQKTKETNVVRGPIIEGKAQTKNERIKAPVYDWQKILIVKIAKERLLRLKNNDSLKHLDVDELDILSKVIEKTESITDWTKLVDIVKNNKVYGILNIAILDHLYKILPKKTLLYESIQTINLMDCINDGIELKDGEVDYLPEKLDITASLIRVLNNDLEITNRKNKLTVQTVKRACLELVSNGGYMDLNWAAKQVICRTIIDNLSKTIYNYNNVNTILSDENKIYLRLIAITLANTNYTNIVNSNYS